MSSTDFAWESLLQSDAPSGCVLKAALFTTYDRADERLLVEHLLPVLLKLSREPESDGAERQYFLLELDRRLKQLYDRLVVVSSTAREEPVDPEEAESGTYAWIWRSIRLLTVGSQRKAVQHAKLWLLHWGASDEDAVEHLEIVVSSTNLTRAAFVGQLQGAWRASIELRPQFSKARLARWGLLPDFLKELAVSAGDGERLADFIEILGRADCPGGVDFVASVPGTHSRQALHRTPWGVAGLRTIAPPGQGTVRVSILSPYIGSWNAKNLTRWCAAFEGAPERLELVWINKDHPWARTSRWILPEATLKTLIDTGASLLQLRYDRVDVHGMDLFHEEHRQTDDRWSHAKVYSFRRGPSRRLLVTSANFSISAWGVESGDGNLIIENFELGVCIAQAAWPFENLERFDNAKDVATVSEPPCRISALISWAQAAWDGKNVRVDCRCKADQELEGELYSSGDPTPIADWTGRDLRSARIPWEDSNRLPSFIQLTCDDEKLNVPVFDERPMQDREDTLPPEVDEDAAQAMLDELLFEQYGGHVAVDDTTEEETEETTEEVSDQGDTSGTLPSGKQGTEQSGPGGDTDEGPEEGVAGRSDSYGVPAFDLARRHLGVVDSWANQLCRAANNGADFDLQVLRRDGELLSEAFQRQAVRDGKKTPASSIGARLAAEELTLRLKHFLEE